MADIEQARQQMATGDEILDLSEKTQTQIQGSKSERDESFLVAFGPDDLENPKNWSNKVKWGVTFALSATGFNRIMVSTVSLLLLLY